MHPFGSSPNYAQGAPSKHQTTVLPASPSPPMSHPNTSDPAASLSDSLNYLALSSSPGHSLSALDGTRPLSRTVVHHHPPRRTPSSTSLRDERRKSTPGLIKRSSMASLRSARTGGSTSPRPSLPAQRSSHALAGEHMTPTAASIAAEHFRKEVELHQSTDLQSKTLVILQDACYGHRFSRPRTSKAALSTIVERPERVHASVLGVSAAYVRLGRRHAGEMFSPHPDLDPRHLPVPFQIRKTDRTLALNSPAVTNVHGSKWMDDLKSMCDAAESRLALNGRELVRPRSANKDDTVADAPQLHEGDLYLCSESLNAFEGALGGVCEGVDAVFCPDSVNRAFVCIRPPGHHCSSGHPSGFCWINNVHVGISYAAMTHGLTHAAILDFDLHHGDGSQEVAWEQNRKAVAAHRNSASYKKTMIGYFSMHDINSYPCEMGEPDKVRNASICIDKAHGQSIWNIHLEPWRNHSEFWELYRTKYSILINKARAFLRLHTERLSHAPNGPSPKAAVFISAGFDASEWEGAGMQRHKVNVPTDFYAKFTVDVARMAEEKGLGVDGRIISVLEGGYSDRALASGVFSHLAGLGYPSSSSASDLDLQNNSLAFEMTGRLELPAGDSGETDNHAFGADFRTEWWESAMLDELEALAYPPPSPTMKPREKSGPSYFAPTRSFSAKVITPPRDRKSTSSRGNSDPDSPPPLPEVGWATAAHELSKILIPSNRQTMSYRSEELNAEASRARRERQMAADRTEATTATDESKMQLRSRKLRSSSRPNTPKKESVKPLVLKGGRRTTIDVASSTQTLSANKSARSAGRGESTPAGQDTSAGAAGHVSSRPPSRPGTSMSARSSSSTAARKTAATRTVASKQSKSPKRVPPVPKVPPTLDSGVSLKGQELSVSASNGKEVPSSRNDNTGKHDMDSLSAGIQKLSIKLKVPSPEENAIREKERKAAEERRRASSKTVSKKIGGVKDYHLTGSKSTSTTSLPPLAPSNTETSLPIATKAKKGVGYEDQEPVSPLSTSPLASLSTPVDSATEASGTHAAAGVEHSGADNPVDASSTVITPQAISTTISPPLTPGGVNNTTPPQPTLFSPPVSASQTKHGLPVFTSSGPIPFASNPQ